MPIAGERLGQDLDCHLAPQLRVAARYLSPFRPHRAWRRIVGAEASTAGKGIAHGDFTIDQYGI